MGLVIYKSSAGSGKTFTLVNSFLTKVLERPWLFNRILAITFTNKAAEELKTRIIRELDVLSKGLPSHQLRILREKLPKITEDQLRENAGIVLLKILHDYSSFAVSTIDSYFQKLARTLARELLLPIKYEIELDTESICKNVTDLLLDEAGKDPFVTKWLEELLLQRIETGKSWNIRSDLYRMTKEVLYNESLQEHATATQPEDLLSLITWLKKFKKEIELHLRNSGSAAIELIRKNGYDVNSFFQKSKGPVGYFYKISEFRSGKKEFENINTFTQKALLEPAAFLSKENQKDDQQLAFVTDHLHPALKKIISYYETNKVKYVSVCEALKLIYLSGISGALDNKLKAYREENQLFHLSDTTRMLSKSIADQDAPFIYEKSGNTFLHIFIDEFQDTATIQWQILKPLIINSLSTGNEVLLVGDAKQSIYRWRGGNMQLLLEGVRKELNAIGYKTIETNLDTNWRSKKEIVEFNNTFFPLAASALKNRFESASQIFNLAYAEKEVHQHCKSRDTEGGHICFKFFGKEKQDTSADDVHWKSQALDFMTENISALLEKGYTYGDIVILVRKNTDENEIADYLFDEGKHPFISGNALLLSTNTHIRILLNCMRLIAQKDEPLLHAEINHFIQKQQLNPEDKIPLQKRAKLHEQPSWTDQHLIREKEKLSSLPLLFVFYHLLDITNMNLSDPFIQRFGDLLQDFIGSKNSNLVGFLQWYDEHVETRQWSVDLPEGGNAIRIISIHKSKGLEFPVVFIPFMNWDLTPNKNGIIWVESDREEFKDHGKIPLLSVSDLNDSYFKDDFQKESVDTAIDNLNLLYVAFTRPEEKLFVFGPQKPTENQVGKLIAEVFNQNEIWSEKMKSTEMRELIIGDNINKASSASSENSESIYDPSGFTPCTLPVAQTTNWYLPTVKYAFSSDETIFGNLVHECISAISGKADIPFTIKKVLSKNGNQAYRHWSDKLISSVESLWSIMEEKQWTSPHFEIENEIEVCDENGIIHRPDKVLIKGDTAIVIDFKTGKSDDKHHQQVSEYCRLIRKTDINNLSGYLIYTTDKEIVKIV